MIRGGQVRNRQRQRESQCKRSLSEEFVGATVMSTHLARGTGQFGYGGQFTTKVGSMMASAKEAHTGQVLPVDLTLPPVLYNKVSLECLFWLLAIQEKQIRGSTLASCLVSWLWLSLRCQEFL
jgi:hypothetical protein